MVALSNKGIGVDQESISTPSHAQCSSAILVDEDGINREPVIIFRFTTPVKCNGALQESFIIPAAVALELAADIVELNKQLVRIMGE